MIAKLQYLTQENDFMEQILLVEVYILEFSHSSFDFSLFSLC